MFRNCGELAPMLLEACARIAFRHDRVDEASIDFSQVVSTEYRADATVVLRDGGEAPVAAIVVEVQLGVDPDKKYSWPVYVTTLRARLRCPVVLLVVSPSPSIAAWSRASIVLGHPGFALAPVVIQLADVPRMTDLADVLHVPELAVLSAMAHPELEVATVAVSAIQGLPEEQARLYLDLIMAALPPSLRKLLLESHMQGYVYQSEFARKYYSQGLEEGLEQGREQGLEQGREQGLEQGREQGLEQGREQGLEQGREQGLEQGLEQGREQGLEQGREQGREQGLEQGREQGLEQGREQGLEQGREQGLEQGLRTAVLALLTAKLDTVTDDHRAMVDAIHDRGVLTELVAVLACATHASEVHAKLAALRARRSAAANSDSRE